MAVECVAGSHVAPEERFDYFWQQQGEWVEEPNRRRGGESGVQRVIGTQGRLLYSKRQTGHTYRSWLHPFGRPTVLRERDALRGLRLLDVGVPELVFCGARRDRDQQWTALLVTAALEGFTDIDSWYAAGGREQCGELAHERLLDELAQTLARMHKGRWQHGCLYSKHIFVRVSGAGEGATVDVALLDLEKCRQRLTARRAAAHDMQQLRRHSSWNATDWQKLSYFYETAFGSAIKGLT
ncbi:MULTISPECIES: lipopolysaccharide kinase InaA family protein [Pseudomonas]|uniref:InaA protein n=3 Tax=Pseudomonas gessardii TaxID=78544 RepID=A0A7Y1MMB4_9PSED|nr:MULTISPECIES: lipopolysaccharide kinase InaA family protein [Pseudomonas]MBH3420721.1 InaA protein [Pseudomonas gessardii]MCF4980324.1 InaA protein [Pseudomonas gessardii]MCF5085916.1 InaA protein [Pseudomonas gessardii]MCF5095567.1 InaA protein [Pseudomonas gessardii]MCF5109647.1 InaA protein [Pseudomonas gessardii]